MSLFPFFQWCDGTAVGVGIRESRWLFPLIETFHLLGLTVLLGTVLILNLRLFGLSLRRQPVSSIAGSLAPLTGGSLALMLASGSLLFLSEAVKCYNSPPFRVKMLFLLLAIVFHFTAYRRLTTSDTMTVTPLRAKLVASLSLGLWFSVGLAGRVIGYF